MKRLLFILLAFTMLGCSDDDSNNSVNEKKYTGSLVGSWKTVTYIADGKNYDTSDCNNTSGGGLFYTWSFNEDDFVINYSCGKPSEGIEGGVYTFIDGILTATHVDTTIKYNVYDAGNSKLKLEVISSSTGHDLGNFIVEKTTN